MLWLLETKKYLGQSFLSLIQLYHIFFSAPKLILTPSSTGSLFGSESQTCFDTSSRLLLLVVRYFPLEFPEFQPPS